MSTSHIQNLQIANILKELEDDATRNAIELKFLMEELSNRLNRRQASILYLLLIGIRSQTEISKLLGYSTPTICLEIKRIKVIVRQLFLDEYGWDINKYLRKSNKQT